MPLGNIRFTSLTRALVGKRPPSVSTSISSHVLSIPMGSASYKEILGMG